MPDETQTLERAVARFIVNFGSGDIDAAGRHSLTQLIKDQLAIQIGASQLPWSMQVRQFRKPRPGSSTIVGETAHVAAADAAYLNATYGHGFEYDDYIGNAHPGCCVVPTGLAIGEEVGATLEEVAVAMVAGYEVYARIGIPGTPEFLLAGWQTHSLLANFGAAAIAAKLFKLDEEQTQHALAIALSHASGPTEYASTGGSIKRVHAGIAVRNGIESAELARAGITGPRRFLTGSRGLYRTFIRKDVGHDMKSLFDPGQVLSISSLSFKAYCCCALTHAYIETMAPLRGRTNDVASIDANIQSMTDVVVGTSNANLYQPRNIEELQYSLPAQMALSALGMGNGYRTHRDFMEGKLDLGPDSNVMRLARKIRLNVSPELDRLYPHFVAEVMVNYADGTTERIFQERSTGSPTIPFTKEQHQAKLNELTEEMIGSGQAEELFDLVDRLEPDMPVGRLTALLARRPN